MSDIECPRCHRISFSWETRYACDGCHWPIRPPAVAEPYNFDVLIEKRSANGMTATTQVRHYKVNETTARRRARPLGKVLAVVPLTQTQWLAAYGEGRM